jgi:hypothetical protein
MYFVSRLVLRRTLKVLIDRWNQLSKTIQNFVCPSFDKNVRPGWPPTRRERMSASPFCHCHVALAITDVDRCLSPRSDKCNESTCGDGFL